MKVQAIIDHPKKGRVRVPEKLVAYVSGEEKRTRDGKINTLRRSSRDSIGRVSRCQSSRKKKGRQRVQHRLNEDEKAEMDRAARKGFLSLVARRNWRTRKGSPLMKLHREWCDSRGKPQIVLLKAVGDRSVDKVLVDLSPLRLNGLFDDLGQADDLLIKWKAEILMAASNAGMDLACEEDEGEPDETTTAFSASNDDISTNEWATKPIWKLPVVSIGIFRGERVNAKAMSKAIADQWKIPEKVARGDEKSHKEVGASKGDRRRTKGLSKYRKRGGGH